MKPSTPFSLSTLLLMVALMAAIVAFGGLTPAQASQQSSPSSSSQLKSSTSGRIQNSRNGEQDLNMAASSLASAAPGKSSAFSSPKSVVDDDSSVNTKESALEPRGLESNIANAKIKLTTNDMATAAGSHHGKSHGKYYMYAEVPKKNSYKMGFKRGNGKHLIERKESAHKSHVHSYFKWHDKKGKGSHKFEFKHEGKGKKGHY